MFSGIEKSGTTSDKKLSSGKDKKALFKELNEDLDKDIDCELDLTEEESTFVPDPDDVGEPWTLEQAGYYEEKIPDYVIADDDISVIPENIKFARDEEEEEEEQEEEEQEEEQEEEEQSSTMASSKKRGRDKEDKTTKTAEIGAKKSKTTASSDASAVATSSSSMSASLKSATVPINATIPYAPNKKPIAGNYTLCAIAIKWKDKSDVATGAMASAARSTQKIYENISKGYIKMPVTSKVVKVPYNHAKKNLNKAERYAIRAVGAGYYAYAIMNSGLSGSHAGARIMHMEGTLKRTWYHERGHSEPFGLGHSGRGGDPYGDPTSFMGKFPCNNINGPQEYAEGWAGDFKTGQYNDDSNIVDYPFESRFTKEPDPKNVTGVLIPRSVGRDMFLSTYTRDKQLLFGLYLITETGKGTTLVKSFSNKAEYSGLKFEKVSTSDTNTVMRISPSPV